MCHCNADLPQNCYVFIHATPGERVGLVTRGIIGQQPPCPLMQDGSYQPATGNTEGLGAARVERPMDQVVIVVEIDDTFCGSCGVEHPHHCTMRPAGTCITSSRMSVKRLNCTLAASRRFISRPS